MKAKFVKRCAAYLIDIFIVVMISTLITSFIPINKEVRNMEEELVDILSNSNKENFNISANLDKVNDLNYNISKDSVITSLVNIVIYIIYFMIYPVYNNGQTVGKKIVKIKIKNLDGELSINNLVIRGIILYGIWYSLINLILIMVLRKNSYLSVSNILGNLNSVVIVVIIFMIAIRKDGRGLHDILGNTVVEEE